MAGGVNSGARDTTLSPNPLDDEKNYLKRILEKSAIPCETLPKPRKTRARKAAASVKSTKGVVSGTRAKRGLSSTSAFGKNVATSARNFPTKYYLRSAKASSVSSNSEDNEFSAHLSEGNTSRAVDDSLGSQPLSVAQDGTEKLSSSPCLCNLANFDGHHSETLYSSRQPDSHLGELPLQEQGSTGLFSNSETSVETLVHDDTIFNNSQSNVSQVLKRQSKRKVDKKTIVDGQVNKIANKDGDTRSEIMPRVDQVDALPPQNFKKLEQNVVSEIKQGTELGSYEQSSSSTNLKQEKGERERSVNEKSDLACKKGEVENSTKDSLKESLNELDEESESKRLEKERKEERKRKRAMENEELMERKRREREEYRKEKERRLEEKRKERELERIAKEKEMIAREKLKEAEKKRRERARIKREKEREREIKKEKSVAEPRNRKQGRTSLKKKEVCKNEKEDVKEPVQRHRGRKKKADSNGTGNSDSVKHVPSGKRSIFKHLPSVLKGPVEKRSFNFEYIRDNIQRIPRPRHCRSSTEDVATCGCVHIDGEIDCGTGCINRQLCIECTPGYCSCPNCTNMVFQQHKYANVMPYKTNDARGYGLITLEDIDEDQFVIEYVGEVIDKEEKARRIANAPSDSHFYIMQVGPDVFLDASRRGNLSRFMNHSCEPNCVPVKWSVGGRTRIGIFSLRFIHAGEELTFDYQFQREGSKRQKCFCGAPHCKGYIG